MVLVELQYWVGMFVTIARWLLVGAAFYYLWLIFKGGSDEGATEKKIWGFGAEKGKAFAKWVSKISRSDKRFKKAVLGEFLDLKELKKAVNDPAIKTKAVKDPAGANEDLKKAVGNSDEKAKRHETHSLRRFSKLQKAVRATNTADISDESKTKLEEILKEMEVFNNTIIRKLKDFDVILAKKVGKGGSINFPEKIRQLNRVLDEAIVADEDLVVELEKLQKLKVSAV